MLVRKAKSVAMGSRGSDSHMQENKENVMKSDIKHNRFNLGCCCSRLRELQEGWGPEIYLSICLVAKDSKRLVSPFCDEVNCLYQMCRAKKHSLLFQVNLAGSSYMYSRVWIG